MKKKKMYLIYDSRYHTEPERATVMAIYDTKEEAEKEKENFGDHCVVIEEFN